MSTALLTNRFIKAKDLCQQLNRRFPLIIQAPMAEGITTPKLVASVCNTGGLGSFAAGYLPLNEIKKNIFEIKQLTPHAFSVNLFANLKPQYDLALFQKFDKKLVEFRDKLKVESISLEAIQQKITNEPKIDEIVDLLCAEKIKVVTFTFGTLLPKQMQKLKEHQTIIMGTATSLKEALYLQQLGCDAVIAQGYEAGGHRGNFLSHASQAKVGLFAFLQQLDGKLDIPIIASGGIANGHGMLAAMILGASGTQLGTSFLVAQQSGINLVYLSELEKASQSLEDPTLLTNAYTGRDARGICTEYMKKMANEEAIPDYPIPHYMTSAIRKNAAIQHKPEYMSLWAGQSLTKAPFGESAEKIIENLYRDFEEASKDVQKLFQNVAESNSQEKGSKI